jgi:hypothetical protein
MDATGDRKLFLGARLKRLRRDLSLTQTAMAADLRVSPSYLNHIERNQRPVSAQLLLRLAETYDVDLRALGRPSGPDLAQLTELFTDPLFEGLPVPRHEALQLAEEAPAAAEALVRLYRAFADRRDRERVEADRLGVATDVTAADHVRDFIQSRDNHFPELDTLGEALHAELTSGAAPGLPSESLDVLIRARLLSRHGLSVRVMPAEVMVEWTRRYDPHRGRLLLSESLSPSSRAFACAYQLVLIELGARLDEMADAASLPDRAARDLLKIALTNALSAAVLMPYAAFRRAAEETGYDLSRLMARFSVGFEQAAHRLTTLSRPTARGVPFFLMRVDQAGNVSKRFASDAFPFARLGGACPRWKLYSAFRTPGRIVTQIIETPDGRRWFTLARTVTRHGGQSWGGEPSTEGHDLAIGLGCELRHAHRLVYARGLDLERPQVTPIGPACRLCDRHPCAERAAPPADRPLTVDDWSKSVSAYPFG